MNEILLLMKDYSEKYHKNIKLNIYFDGSGFIDSQQGDYFEYNTVFEFNNVDELIQKLYE